jgi:hypothetical protein
LGAALALQAIERTDLHVVLSNHFVRYALLPGSEALDSDAEWSAYAAHVFEATHGRAARSWTVSVAPAGRGHARIASAIDTVLLESIRTQAARFPHVRLQSVRPYLAGAFDRVRASLENSPTWIAVVEEGRAVIALVVNGRWLTIRARQIGGAWAEDLRTAIEREEAMLNAPSGAERLIVVSDTENPHTAPSLGRLRVSDVTLGTGMALDLRRCALVFG